MCMGSNEVSVEDYEQNARACLCTLHTCVGITHQHTCLQAKLHKSDCAHVSVNRNLPQNHVCQFPSIINRLACENEAFQSLWKSLDLLNKLLLPRDVIADSIFFLFERSQFL